VGNYQFNQVSVLDVELIRGACSKCQQSCSGELENEQTYSECCGDVVTDWEVVNG
jgi:hypothetical protein